MEEILFEMEEEKSRDEVAAYLQRIVDKLESGESIALKGGGDEVDVDVPDRLEFEVKVEEEAGERSLEFELEWSGSEDGAGDGLEIA